MPQKIKGLKNDYIVNVACGYNHAIASSGKNLLYAWGDQAFGKIALNPNEGEPISLKPTNISNEFLREHMKNRKITKQSI